jgi:hemerythrin superfamily protein
MRMFRKRQERSHAGLYALTGFLVAGGAALVAVLPVLKRRAMRATTILKKDHRVVSGLFWTLRQTPSASARKSIFNQIEQLLETHTQAEEELFYPAVRNLYTTMAEEQVDEAVRQHQRIRSLVYQVSRTDPGSFEFMSKVNELREAVEQHVEEEENEMFPLAQDNISSRQLDAIGRRIHDRKLQIKERLAA